MEPSRVRVGDPAKAAGCNIPTAGIASKVFPIRKARLCSTNRLNLSVLWIFFAVITSTPSSESWAASSQTGLSAHDVGVKMSASQRNDWVYGAADMAAHLYRRLGDAERADCVLDWSSSDNSVEEIDSALRANPSLSAAAVLEVLSKRHCGDYR